MLRDLLSSRLIQAGMVFFVLIVGGSLLYSWHVHRTTIAEFKPIPQSVVSSPENTVPTNTAPVVFQNDGITNTPNETTAVETIDETEALDLADAFLPDDMATAETPTEEEGVVSPYGFGPYPELPEGWSPNTFPASTPEHELLKRVRIKLISQGINAEGAAYRNNLIYPIVKGTVYVKWESSEFPNGVRRYISGMYGHLADVPRLEALRDKAGREKRSFSESEVPLDIKLIPFTEGGIDPYEFLNLERR